MTENNELSELIKEIDTFIENPRKGLPQDVFFHISRLTPMVNVDLLIKNNKNQTLLTWRHDEFYHGWHIAGGILRFKELAADRIKAVAMQELGATVISESAPITVLEKIAPNRDTRGHFISMMYRCELTSELDAARECKDINNPSAPSVDVAFALPG